MLIAFKVSNFQAFRDPQELSLRRARGMRTTTSEAWDPGVSSVAAIYGANASGKSTFFRALQFFRTTIRDSYRRWDIDDSTEVRTFALDPEKLHEPAEFEAEFRLDSVDYQYGFVIGHDSVEAEWLYSYNRGYRTMIFDRDSASVYKVRFGSKFRGSRKALFDLAQTRTNALTLSAGAQLGNVLLQKIFRSLTRDLRTYDARNYEAGHAAIIKRAEKDERFVRKLTAVLSRADLGVTGLEIQSVPMDEDTLSKAMEVAKVLGKDVDEHKFRSFTEERSRTIQLAHTAGGNEVVFPNDWESAGTQALISFAAVAMDALEEGATMVVDEIDTSLHPLLVAELIAAFASSETNPRQAQLIFTTHDVSLLDRVSSESNLLWRDQIWVTEKGADGASSLIAISDYRTPRKEENLARGYMTGRYGGVPVLSVFSAFRPDEVVEA